MEKETFREIEKCLICGKKMIPAIDMTLFKTKRWDGHSYKFQCKCHKKNLRISIG